MKLKMKYTKNQENKEREREREREREKNGERQRERVCIKYKKERYGKEVLIFFVRFNEVQKEMRCKGRRKQRNRTGK